MFPPIHMPGILDIHSYNTIKVLSKHVPLAKIQHGWQMANVTFKIKANHQSFISKLHILEEGGVQNSWTIILSLLAYSGWLVWWMESCLSPHAYRNMLKILLMIGRIWGKKNLIPFITDYLSMALENKTGILGKMWVFKNGSQRDWFWPLEKAQKLPRTPVFFSSLSCICWALFSDVD